MYLFPGRSRHIGSYFEFVVAPADATDLAVRLRNVAETRRDAYLQIGDMDLRLTYGSETGNATYHDGILVFQTNAVDLVRLADELDGIVVSIQQALGAVEHVHLEPAYMVASPSVEDIVIEVLP
jgi:hypothetical protein